MATLPDREFTLDEIAEALGGVSRQRVQQLERKAMEHFLQELKRRGLTLSDLLPDHDREDNRG